MADIKRISPKEAHEKMGSEGYVYVDVRSEPEYEAGHPAGAYNVPIAHMTGGGMAPNPDFMRAMNALFPKNAKLVLGCKAGGRSLRAAEMLAADGYTDVIDQRAGWDGARDPFGQMSEPGWGRAGLPAETATPGRAWADVKSKG